MTGRTRPEQRSELEVGLEEEKELKKMHKEICSHSTREDWILEPTIKVKFSTEHHKARKQRSFPHRFNHLSCRRHVGYMHELRIKERA